MIWKPNVTVAAVIENEGKFLLVEEETAQGILFNQPAGHLDQGESIVEAAIRETLEETAHHFSPEFLVGVYQWHSSHNDVTYLRFAFSGKVTGKEDRPLDKGIISAQWLSLAEIKETKRRSPLVLKCIEDYLCGIRYPLNLITRSL